MIRAELRHRATRAREAHDNHVADLAVAERAKLAAVNKRRRARGQAPLLRLPDEAKGFGDDLDAIDFYLDVMEPEAKAMTHEPLDRSPRSNWVEKAGQLPAYIQHIAKDLHEERGMDLSRAIATAISRCKVWAAGGGGVKPDTRAKAAAAIAEWEALKAKAHAKYDSELLAELEQKAIDFEDAIDDAYAFLYEQGEFKTQVGTSPDYLQVDAETGETIGTATVQPLEEEPAGEVKALTLAEIHAAAELRRSLLD